MNNDDIYSWIQQEIIKTAMCFGIDIDVSIDMAEAIAERLQKLLGKTTVYFPEKVVDVRNAQIRAEFNGTNRDELMKKHGISSKTTFYAAIRQR